MAERLEFPSLPHWPRFLSRAQAAAYVGVSVDVFDAEVASGKWPPGVPRGAKGGKLTWDRCALDIAADRLSGLGAPAATGASLSPEAAAWEKRLNAKAQGIGHQRRAPALR
jgi:hypothetical protein